MQTTREGDERDNAPPSLAERREAARMDMINAAINYRMAVRNNDTDIRTASNRLQRSEAVFDNILAEEVAAEQQSAKAQPQPPTPANDSDEVLRLF